MRSVLLTTFLAGVPLVASAPHPAPSVHPDIVARALLGPRGTCEPDVLAHKLSRNTAEAIPFCRSFLGIEASTSVVATVTNPAVTVIATETLTLTYVKSATITNLETTYTTATETVVVTTVTQTQAIVKARGTKTALAESLFSNYPETQIHSACACLTIPMCFKKATMTIAASTETSAETFTVDATSTATETALATTTEGTTVTESATATTFVAPPAPTLPTADFRIVTTDASGNKMYFKRTPYVLGDLMYQTPDVAEALTFQVDAQRRLAINSPAYPSGPAYPFFGSSWWSSSAAKVVPFNLASYSSSYTGGDVYLFDIDYTTGRLSSSTPGFTAVFQTCKRGFNGASRDVWFVHQSSVESGCTMIFPTIEFV